MFLIRLTEKFGPPPPSFGHCATLKEELNHREARSNMTCLNQKQLNYRKYGQIHWVIKKTEIWKQITAIEILVTKKCTQKQKCISSECFSECKMPVLVCKRVQCVWIFLWDNTSSDRTLCFAAGLHQHSETAALCRWKASVFAYRWPRMLTEVWAHFHFFEYSSKRYKKKMLEVCRSRRRARFLHSE